MRAVIMNSTSAGPLGTFVKGATVRVDDDTAAEWVRSGFAAYADAVPDKVEVVEEAIALPAPEKAVKRRTKRRRKKKAT